MGFFSSKKTCNWCGLKFKGPGLQTADGILLCSQECKDAKEAPALAPLPSEPPAEYVPPYEETARDIKAAEQKFTEYHWLIDRALTIGGNEAFNNYLPEAEIVSADLWAHLIDARNTLEKNDQDLSVFDEIRSENRAESYHVQDESYGVGVGLSVKHTVDYDIDPSGVQTAAEALSELKRVFEQREDDDELLSDVPRLHRVALDGGLCEGCGDCAEDIPEVFDWNEEGERAYVVQEVFPFGLKQDILDVAHDCLGQAIRIKLIAARRPT